MPRGLTTLHNYLSKTDTQRAQAGAAATTAVVLERLDNATPWSPEQAGSPYPSPIAWEKYRAYLREDIDAAGRAHDCAKLEEIFRKVADLPHADELLIYVDRWGVHTECFKDE